jgi:hypothetical protein
MPLAPYLLRYRQFSGGDPEAPSPTALIPPNDDTLPALDPTMQMADYSQTQSPLPPPPVSFASAANDLQLPTNGASGANQIPLQPLNQANGTSGGGSPSYSGIKQLANRMPPPGSANTASNATPVAPIPDTSAPTAPTTAPTTAPIVPATSTVPPATPTPNSTAGTPPPTQSTIDKLNTLHAQRPDAPNSNWAQRLAGAILSMTKLAPVANQIIHPKYSAQQAAYQGAEADLNQQLKEQEGAENIAALAQQRQGQSQKLQAQAQELADIPAQKKAAALEAQHKAFVESMGKNAIEITPGDPIPSGYHAFQDPSDPNKLWVRPSAFISLPKELLPMFPGKNVGDLVTSGEYDAGQQSFRTQQLENLKSENKADNKTPQNEAQIALAAQDPDPAVSGPAKAALSALAAQHLAERPPRQPTAAEEKLAVDSAIRDAYNRAGGDWNRVLTNARSMQYGNYNSDIADHAQKMTTLPTDAQRKVAAADTTVDQVQRAIQAIDEVTKTHPELVGPVTQHPINALTRKVETLAGSEPPDVGATDSILETAAALQPGQHNFRSIGALAEFKKALGIDPRTGKADGSRAWLQNPAKAKAALQQVADFNQRLKENTISASGKGTPINNVPKPDPGGFRSLIPSPQQ